MLKQERQAKIISQIRLNRTATVTQLSEILNVSEITIRRDLDELADSEKIQRIHGGGALLQSDEREPPILHRQNEQAIEKEAIARQALNFFKNGDTIGIESGSTTLAMARLIARQAWDNLHIVTNSIPILNLLLPFPGIHVMFLGGMINPSELCSNCNPTDAMLKHIHIDTYFCGCRGLHPNFGRSNEMQNGIEIGTVRSFVSASDRIVVLADHTKFSKTFPLQLLQITEIDIVITSKLAPNKVLDDIREQGVIVEIAPQPKDLPNFSE